MSNSSVRSSAPLLAVVGGPTGAGKSTLVNSLVRAPVSPVGVLRPTTRTPVLICNPADTARVHRHGLRPIGAPMLPVGIAVIDAPDMDSIEEANRPVAEELFAAADLWLFVITATRYADAAAWRHLELARARGMALAVVLDRVPAHSALEIIDHLRELLGEPEPPLFVVPESLLDRQGMLPEAVIAPLRDWLAAVVAGPPSEPDRPDEPPAAQDDPASAEWRAPAPEEWAVPASSGWVAPTASPSVEAETSDESAASTRRNRNAVGRYVTGRPGTVRGAEAASTSPENSTADPRNEAAAVETADATGEVDTPAGGRVTDDGEDNATNATPDGLDEETPVGETVGDGSRPTPQPVGAARPSEGPPADPGGQA